MVSCKKLAQNLSAYIEGDVDHELRGEIERHLLHCRRCSVLLDSVRKVILISGDDRTFELPMGYEKRLHSFLDRHI
ncbi:MAG: anti-sigma factor family protein [Terracidiphilus sp.]